jgi:O-phosphoseryl-tRNA(Cys) synthetase
LGSKTETDYRITKGTGWLEIGGCGMVDPNVLKTVASTHEYNGFAFGMGSRAYRMLLYQIGDIRMFYENDVRFLEAIQIYNLASTMSVSRANPAVHYICFPKPGATGCRFHLG